MVKKFSDSQLENACAGYARPDGGLNVDQMKEYLSIDKKDRTNRAKLQKMLCTKFEKSKRGGHRAASSGRHAQMSAADYYGDDKDKEGDVCNRGGVPKCLQIDGQDRATWRREPHKGKECDWKHEVNCDVPGTTRGTKQHAQKTTTRGGGEQKRISAREYYADRKDRVGHVCDIRGDGELKCLQLDKNERPSWRALNKKNRDVCGWTTPVNCNESMYEDTARLEKACDGKSETQGGLNVPDIKEYLKFAKGKKVGRDALEDALCESLETKKPSGGRHRAQMSAADYYDGHSDREGDVCDREGVPKCLQLDQYEKASWRTKPYKGKKCDMENRVNCDEPSEYSAVRQQTKVHYASDRVNRRPVHHPSVVPTGRKDLLNNPRPHYAKNGKNLISARDYYERDRSDHVGNVCDVRGDGELKCLQVNKNSDPSWRKRNKTNAKQCNWDEPVDCVA